MKRENETYKSFGQNHHDEGNNDKEEEDYSYEIETTQNNPIVKHCVTTDSVSPGTPSYIEKLEAKIRDQAKRLSSLEKYKYLCEKKIKQINPAQTFPITEEMLTARIAETDIINQEETNNYIALLKQTIDSDLIKKGLLTKYINIDGVIELEKLRNETENYRKNLVLAQTMVNSLKSDVDDLIKENGELKMIINSNMINYPSQSNKSQLSIGEEGKIKSRQTTKENEKHTSVNAYINANNTVNVLEYKNLQSLVNELKAENSLLAKQLKAMRDKQRDVCRMSDEQMDLINKKLNEYKSNYEKIRQDFEFLLNENTQLKQENNRVIDDNKISRDYICSLEVEIDQMKSMLNNQTTSGINEDYKKMYEAILIENNNFKKMLTNPKNQFPEIDTLSSNKDKDNNNDMLQNEYNALQMENEKIKIDFTNLLNEKNNLDKESEQNKNKLKTLNLENVRLALENDRLLKNISSFNDRYNKEIEGRNGIIKQIKDEATKAKSKNEESNKNTIAISSNYEEVLLKYNELNEKYSQLEEEAIELKSRVNNANNKELDLQTQVSLLEKENKKLKSQCLQFEKENNAIKSSENKLKEIVELTENKVEETLTYNDLINSQLKKMELEIDEKNQLISQYKDDKSALEDELNEKMKMFDTYVSDTKESIAKLLGEMFVISGKFDKIANQDLDSLLSKSFSQGITQIISQINTIKNVSNYDLTLNDRLFFETITKFHMLISKELENVYDKVFDSNQCIKESNNHILTLEEEMKTKQIVTTNENFNRINELENQMRVIQTERQALYNNLSKMKDEYTSIEKTNEKLSEEVSDFRNQSEEWKVKCNKNELKISMLTKRNKTLMTQMQKLIKIFPYKDLAKTILDMLNVSESVQKLEFEGMNLEDQLNIIEKEYNNLLKDKSINSSELCTIVTTEYHNLKRLINDYKQKIQVKNDKMAQLNKEYNKLETNYKMNIEANVENYQKALKEIAQLKNILSNSKGNHLSSPRNVIIEATLKEGETNRLEINSLDSNILSERLDKSNNTIGIKNNDDVAYYNYSYNNSKEDKALNSVDQETMLTNYDEIEQEVIMKSKSNINVNTNSSQNKSIKQY